MKPAPRLPFAACLLASAPLAAALGDPAALFDAAIGDPVEPPRLVVLENGGVLRGRVRLVGETYVITADGAEIRAAAGQVRLIARSLPEAAERLRAGHPEPTVEDRLRLAAWCERHRLWREAAVELMAAQRESPRDPRVAHAQRELWHARQMRLREAAERRTRDDRNAGRDAGRADAGVRPASFNPSMRQEGAGESNPDGALQEIDPPLSRRAPMPQLSAEAVQEFTRRIQPILVNNCTTAGCHAVGGPERFQLNRDVLHGLASHRSTRANLDAVVRALSAADAEASPLLLAMQPSHAGGRVPRRSHRWGELQTRVADWAEMAIGFPEAPTEPTKPTDAPSAAPTQPSGEGLSAAHTAEELTAPGYYEALLGQPSGSHATGSHATGSHATGSQSAGGPSTGGSQRAPMPAAVIRGVAPVKRIERDEFDPETFNQRYGGSSTPAAD